MGKLMNLLMRRQDKRSSPVCLWAGQHDGDAVCELEIQRECGHTEHGGPICVGHLRGMLQTGGTALNPASCFREDCDVVSLARVVDTTDIPGPETE